VVTIHADGAQDEDVQGHVRDACEECIGILRELEKSQAKPAIKVLCASTATTRTCFPSSYPIFVDIVLQRQSRDTHSPTPYHTAQSARGPQRGAEPASGPTTAFRPHRRRRRLGHGSIHSQRPHAGLSGGASSSAVQRRSSRCGHLKRRHPPTPSSGSWCSK
jgi:hypothetical protein